MKPPAGSRVRPDHPRIEHEGFASEDEKAWM